MPAVRADQVERPARLPGPAPTGRSSSSAGSVQLPQPTRSRPARESTTAQALRAGRGPPAGAADQQHPDAGAVLPPADQLGADRTVQRRLEQRLRRPSRRAARPAASAGSATRCRTGCPRAARPTARTGPAPPAGAGRQPLQRIPRPRRPAGGPRPGGHAPAGTTIDSRSSRATSVRPSAGSSPGSCPAASTCPDSSARTASAVAGRQGERAVGQLQHDRCRRRPAAAGAAARRGPGPRSSSVTDRAAAAWASGPTGVGPGLCPHATAQPVGDRARVGLAEPAGQRLDGRGQVGSDRVRVGHVDAERQRGAQLRLLRGQRGQRLDQRVPGHRVDADGQVYGHVAERLGRVQPAAGQVERVAGAQHGVDRRLALGLPLPPPRGSGSTPGPAAAPGAPARGWSTASPPPPAARTRRARRSGPRIPCSAGVSRTR